LVQIHIVNEFVVSKLQIFPSASLTTKLWCCLDI